MDEVALWRKFFSRREEGFMEDKVLSFFFPHRSTAEVIILFMFPSPTNVLLFGLW
jgi:hypothetical protein